MLIQYYSEAKEIFHTITLAYEVLSSPNKKK